MKELDTSMLLEVVISATLLLRKTIVLLSSAVLA